MRLHHICDTEKKAWTQAAVGKTVAALTFEDSMSDECVTVRFTDGSVLRLRTVAEYISVTAPGEDKC
jgi:hypothetical protein